MIWDLSCKRRQKIKHCKRVREESDGADNNTTKSKVGVTATEISHLEDIDMHVDDTEEKNVILEEPDPHIKDA